LCGNEGVSSLPDLNPPPDFFNPLPNPLPYHLWYDEYFSKILMVIVYGMGGEGGEWSGLFFNPWNGIASFFIF